MLDATADPATPAQQLPVLAPTLRRTAVVERVRGTVSVRPRGKKKFVRLTDPALVRLGSEIDTERGVARLTVATDAKGTLGPATVRGGRFVVTQGAGSKPVSQLALSRKLSCAKPKKSKARGRPGRLRLRQAPQEPPAVGQHPHQALPHQGPLRHGHRARHALADHRRLPLDPDPGLARCGHRARPGAQAQPRGARGPQLHGDPALICSAGYTPGV